MLSLIVLGAHAKTIYMTLYAHQDTSSRITLLHTNRPHAAVPERLLAPYAFVRLLLPGLGLHADALRVSVPKLVPQLVPLRNG